MAHRVGAKGQVVIPKDLRDELGIEPGDEVIFWRDGDHIALRPTRHARPLRGRFAGVSLVDGLAAERDADRRHETPAMTVVLDSWAVLRYLENEPIAAGAATDLQAVERPLVSWIDTGEVPSVLRRAVTEADGSETVRNICSVIDVRPPDERVVLDAARIKAEHPLADADADADASAQLSSSQPTRRCGRATLSSSSTGPRGGGGTCVTRPDPPVPPPRTHRRKRSPTPLDRSVLDHPLRSSWRSAVARSVCQ